MAFESTLFTYKIYFTWNLNNEEARELLNCQAIEDKGIFLEICLENWGSGFNLTLPGYYLFCENMKGSNVSFGWEMVS